MTTYQTEAEHIERVKSQARIKDAAKPLHARRFAGQDDDYQIIDENGRTVWASDWCKKAFQQTRPRALVRY